MEAAEDGALVPPACANRLRDDPGRGGILNLDQQIDLRARGPREQIVENDDPRRSRFDLGRGQIRDQVPVDREVVADDEHAVARRLDIALDRVRAFGDGCFGTRPSCCRGVRHCCPGGR